jgi:hypothetical protein
MCCVYKLSTKFKIKVLEMFRINYTCEFKTKHNYSDDVKRDSLKERGNCHSCVFSGENEHFSKRRLCAETMSEITEVDGNGYCDKCRPCWHWYNQINPIKKWLLERSGFVFKNR